jgi:hypothetical protein
VNPCHADASSEEKRSPDGQANQQTALQPSLAEHLNDLIAAMQQQNMLLMQLIEQNGLLIQSLFGEPDDDDEPRRDLEGKQVRDS